MSDQTAESLRADALKPRGTGEPIITLEGVDKFFGTSRR